MNLSIPWMFFKVDALSGAAPTFQKYVDQGQVVYKGSEC